MSSVWSWVRHQAFLIEYFKFEAKPFWKLYIFVLPKNPNCFEPTLPIVSTSSTEIKSTGQIWKAKRTSFLAFVYVSYALNFDNALLLDQMIQTGSWVLSWKFGR